MDKCWLVFDFFIVSSLKSCQVFLNKMCYEGVINKRLDINHVAVCKWCSDVCWRFACIRS